MNKYIRPKRVGDGWPPPSSPGRFSRFAIQRNDGPQARISGKKGTHAVSLAILANALRGSSCSPRLLLLYFLDSKVLFIAEPQLVLMIFYFALLPFLPTLTPNGGRAEDQ